MDKTAETNHPIHSLLVERWSPYAFADRDVSDEDLRSLFEAARWAPSSYNEQPWSYVVATRQQKEEFERLLSCLVEANKTWARHVLCWRSASRATLSPATASPMLPLSTTWAWPLATS